VARTKSQIAILDGPHEEIFLGLEKQRASQKQKEEAWILIG